MRAAGSLVVAVFLGLCFALPAPAPALADSGSLPTAGVSMSVTPGLGGAIKPGNWAPVLIELANEGRDVNGEVQVTIEDNATRASAFTPTPVIYSEAAVLPSHSRKRFEVDVLLPAQGNRVHVKLVEGRSLLAQQEAQFDPVSANNILCGAVTRDSQAYDVLGTIDIPGRQQHARIVSIDPADLPSRPQVLSSLDCLIVGNVSLAGLTETQKGAIDAWVGHGGLLVGIGGESWTRSLAFLPAGLLPVQPGGSAELPSLDGLAAFAKAPSPGKGPWVVSTPKASNGSDVVKEGNVPLVSIHRYGSGTAFYLAMDPTTSPLREWEGTAQLWRYIFTYVNTPLLSASPFGTSSIGWGRLPRTALSAIPNLNPPAPVWFLALLGLYVLLLGPANYLVLRRLDRREWAWVTLPLIAVATTGAVFRLAADHRGSDVGINQVTIVRSDPGVDTAFVRSYISVYSPRDATLDVLTGNGALVSAQTGAFGLGVRFGGGTQSSFGDGSAPPRVQPVTVLEGGQTTLPGFSATANTFSSFTVDSSARLAGGVTSTLTMDGSFIRGQVVNGTGQKISDATVLLGDTPVARLGTLSPGASRQVSVGLSAADVPRRGQLSAQLYPSAAARPSTASPTDLARRDVLDSAFNPFFQSTGLLNGGLTLIGWLDHSPLEVTLRQGRPALTSQTLLTAGLTVSPTSGQQLAVPPAVFQTRVLASLAANRQQGGTYDLSSGGALGLQFDLPFAAGFVPQKLVLHVAGSMGGTDTLRDGADLGTASWYRWSDGTWVDLPLAVGDNAIPNAGQFVSPAGQVRVRYSYKPPSGVASPSNDLSLSRFDLTVTGATP